MRVALHESRQMYKRQLRLEQIICGHVLDGILTDNGYGSGAVGRDEVSPVWEREVTLVEAEAKKTITAEELEMEFTIVVNDESSDEEELSSPNFWDDGHLYCDKLDLAHQIQEMSLGGGPTLEDLMAREDIVTVPSLGTFQRKFDFKPLASRELIQALLSRGIFHLPLLSQAKSRLANPPGGHPKTTQSQRSYYNQKMLARFTPSTHNRRRLPSLNILLRTSPRPTHLRRKTHPAKWSPRALYPRGMDLSRGVVLYRRLGGGVSSVQEGE
jgi:hypothetical protein